MFEVNILRDSLNDDVKVLELLVTSVSDEGGEGLITVKLGHLSLLYLGRCRGQ